MPGKCCVYEVWEYDLCSSPRSLAVLMPWIVKNDGADTRCFTVLKVAWNRLFRGGDGVEGQLGKLFCCKWLHCVDYLFFGHGQLFTGLG